jgi:hypothetical protein
MGPVKVIKDVNISVTQRVPELIQGASRTCNEFQMLTRQLAGVRFLIFKSSHKPGQIGTEDNKNSVKGIRVICGIASRVHLRYLN